MRSLGPKIASSGARSLSAGVVALAVVLPVLAWWHIQHPGPSVAAQHRPPAVPVGALARVPAIAPYRGGIPILTYHGISTAGGRYTVTPSEFSLQIAALARAGFHSISQQQLVASLTGSSVALPPRPIVLTFDDGAKTVWTRADPVLRRYGFHGVVFVITGRVGTHQPYYLTWDEIEAMRESGRWEFGSHTRAGHQFVLTGPGKTGAFMTNRLWTSNGLESIAGYRTRITTDLDGSIADLTRHGLPRPLLFADPFSASAAAANDRRLLGIALGVEHSRFAALVNNIPPPHLATPAALGGYERRIEVFRGTSPEGLVHAIARAIEATPGVLSAGRHRVARIGGRGHRRALRRVRRAAPFGLEPPLRPEDVAPNVPTRLLISLFPGIAADVPELGIKNGVGNSPSGASRGPSSSEGHAGGGGHASAPVSGGHAGGGGHASPPASGPPPDPSAGVAAQSPGDATPADTTPADTTPTDTTPADTPPTDTTPADAPPTDTTADAPPADTPPADAPPPDTTASP